MKKILEVIGFIFLMIFSFYYTNKTATMVKHIDNIMITIDAEKDKYKIDPIDATITDDTMIPGLSGRKVNLNKSYNSMHKVGLYTESLYVYDTIKPNISINHTFDKYIISGNKSNNNVSLIFKVTNQDNIDKILEILNNNSIKANFFINNEWLINNNDLVNKLINENHVVGSNLDYVDNKFIWMNAILNQKNNYCYSEEKNTDLLKNCALEYNYSILPNIIVKNNPLIEIKKELGNGSIIALNINKEVEDELPLIVKYIKNRNLNIVNLNELLKE